MPIISRLLETKRSANLIKTFNILDFAKPTSKIIGFISYTLISQILSFISYTLISQIISFISYAAGTGSVVSWNW